MKVVLLNGPPRVGKDTAGKALAAHFGAILLKFAEPLKLATHALYGHFNLPADAFECTKGIPSDAFGGLTPREAYITVSERMVKPALGDRFFGRVMAGRLVALRTLGAYLVAVTDSGFAGETAPVVDAIGADNVLLVRLHAEGRGRSFAGDSRGHITIPCVTTFDISNDIDGDPEVFTTEVLWMVSEWLTAPAQFPRAS